MLDANSKTGGVMVYSTCSVAVEENEAVVAYALRNRHVRIEAFAMDDGSKDVGRPVRFSPSVLCVLSLVVFLAAR